MTLSFDCSFPANVIYDGDKESEGEDDGLNPEDSRKVKNFVKRGLQYQIAFYCLNQSLQLKNGSVYCLCVSDKVVQVLIK